MELTSVMIEAGGAYLCGYSKENALRLEDQEKFQDCCFQAKELFRVMQEAAKLTKDNPPSQDLQQQLAEGEPVNDNPHMW